MVDDVTAPAALRAQAERPPKHIVDFAVEVSGWSPCRSKRGVVLFAGADIISHGYNYKPRGFDCDGSEACKATCRYEAVHAEQQALLFAGTRARGVDLLHVKTMDGALVPSGGPSCVQCSKLALVAGVAGVWLYHEDGWRRYETAEFHRLSVENDRTQRQAARAEALREAAVFGDTSDGYHTFNELYAYREAYNAVLFNEWAGAGKFDVHKSWRHSDGEPCFGGGWFIVVAETPAGQVSNHYKADRWELFRVPERERGNAWDGHTPQIALKRLQTLAALRAAGQETKP